MKEPIYVEVSKDDLETQEFETKLRSAYAKKSDSQEVFLVVDGRILKDPNNGRPVQKIGKNLFYGELSGVQFKMDDGNIEHLKQLLRLRPSGLHELRDPYNGMPLIEIEEGIYESENGTTYVATTQDKLEEPEFNERLSKTYAKYERSNREQNVKLIVDGKELTDPVCGGELKKIGTKLFESIYSGNTYFMQNGELLNLREPISGSNLELQEDGRYYSDTLDRYFTLEQAKNGEKKFFPTYLPYKGMEDVSAKLIGDRLVGENGISFPVLENGMIDCPMEDNLTTQEEIDKSIQQKHDLTEKALNAMREKLDREGNEYKSKMEACIAQAEAKIAKINLRIEATKLAGEIECARIKRDSIISASKIKGLPIDPSTLPQMPQIPENIPKELVDAEIKNLREKIAESSQNIGELPIQNVLQVTQTASAKGMDKAMENINKGLEATLSPEKNGNKDKNEQQKEDDEMEIN
ncbi:MAG: hypothetical protein IKL55_03150 [Clostridia bacterium]|nr:hypothetical protein [Clostridia bacterium]